MPPEASDPWPADSIGKVASFVQINDISLMNAEATGIPQTAYDAAEYDTHWRVFVFANGDIIEEATSEEPIEVQDGIDVIIDFEYATTANPSHETEGGKKEQFKLLVAGTFLLRYGLKAKNVAKTDIKQSDIVAFAKFNATVNAWPYWREFVQSMTSRMEIPTVTVPLLPVPVVDL